MFIQTAAAILALIASQAGPEDPSRSSVQAHAHTQPGDPAPSVDVRIDSDREEVVITIPEIRIPPGTHYAHDGPDAHVSFVWPESGWVRGYRIDLSDSAGMPIPRDMLHHVGVVHLGRRQLAYAKPLRIFAAGRETEPVMLPESMGIRMSEGDSIVVYYSLVNSGEAPVDGASLRISLTWRPNGGGDPTEILPLILNANPTLGASSRFDVPAGVSAMSSEFTLPVGGRLRALGGHLHDYAVEIRLEDVLTGRVLARLETERDRAGRLDSVPVDRFFFTRGGLRLEADRPYRVIAVHNNPTGAPIPMGAMAYMAGPFVPDDLTLWPAVDPGNSVYLSDMARLLGEAETGEIAGAGEGPEMHQHPGP